MNLSRALVWALPLSLLSNLGSAVWARKADLTVLPSSKIIYQGMGEGNPRWTWGGTD